MKTLKIIESCLAAGQHAEAGSILENVDVHVAADLIANGRAVEVQSKPDVLTQRDPELENRDPEPPKKAKK